MIIIYYLLQITFGCKISGTLYTPKLYPANNVRIEYQQITTMSNLKGEFEIIVNSKQIDGLLSFNIANQFSMSKYLQSSECPLLLNSIVLDNHQRVTTHLTGCIRQSDTKTGAINGKLNITYDQPTFLDIQIAETNKHGCFSIDDQLMKLLVYKVTVSISVRGYYDKIIDVSLLDSYSFDLQEILIEPRYFPVYLHINVMKQTQISISCELEYKNQFVTSKDQTLIVLDKVFKDSYQYTCGILAQNGDLADFQVLTFKESINMTLDFNLHPFNQKQSVIIGQIVNKNLEGMPEVDVALTYSQKTVKQFTNQQGNYTFYLDLDKITQMTICISKPGFIDQKIQFTPPNPPFTYYVKQIKLLKRTAEIDYHFYITGIVFTKFEDPVNQCQIAIFKGEKIISSSVSDDKGNFKLDTTFKSSAEEVHLKVTHPQFEAYDDEFILSTFNNMKCITNDNKFIQCIDQQIQISPNEIILAISVQFEKKIDGQAMLWLDRVYYDTNHFANPALNNTIKLSKSIKLKQQQSLQLDLPAYDYYLYSLAIYVESDGLSNIVVKNSTETHTVDFGMIQLYNLTKQQHSKFYTQFNGKVIDMIDPSCSQQIQIPIKGVQIKFSLQFVRQSQFINMTTTDSAGLFNLIAYNPIINGQFNGVFVIQKEGYLSNEVDITYLTKDENNQFTIGTIQLINEKGLKEC